MLPTAAFLKPINRPDPRFWFDPTKIFLLGMQIRGDVMAEQSEESGDGEGFVGGADQAVVHGVLVEEDAEPCDQGVNRDHPEDANDTALKSHQSASARERNTPTEESIGILSLFEWFTVMSGMFHNQVQ